MSSHYSVNGGENNRPLGGVNPASDTRPACLETLKIRGKLRGTTSAKTEAAASGQSAATVAVNPSFNLGVEIGQLLFIASVLAIIALARQITRRIDAPRPPWAWAVPPYAIGSLAVFWVIQRTAAF